MGLSTIDLNEIVVFTRVVQAGSFIAASAQLGIPKSTVSRKVADLEKRLNARLLQRTTRKLSLTDVGRTYFDQCARIVGEIEDAERMVTSLQNTHVALFASPWVPTLLSSRPSSATT
jgi:DNA-binding transcriptional LysR family regulator